MSSTRRVFGVDFSGARSAGDSIWIASGETGDGTFVIDECVPARELPDSAAPREECYRALTTFVEDRPDAIFGFDFPFGLPEDITAHRNWASFVREFADTYDSPDHFHEVCKARGAKLPGDGVEYYRETETDADVPWCSYQWRIRFQTYHGIGGFLAGFVEEESARILPMQPPASDIPWVIEVCPSSTLKYHDLPRQGYKETGAASEQRRAQIVEGLERDSLQLTDDVREMAIQDADGDALDSVIAADATARALEQNIRPVGVEGHIYV